MFRPQKGSRPPSPAPPVPQRVQVKADLCLLGRHMSPGGADDEAGGGRGGPGRLRSSAVPSAAAAAARLVMDADGA